MGFWGSLLKGAAGFIPGVGPAISAGLDAVGKVGQGMSAGRAAENQEMLLRDRIGLTAQDSRQDALLAAAGLVQRDKMDMADMDLKRREFARSEATERAKQTILGDVLAGLQKGSFNRPSGVPNISFSGGLSADLLGPNSRAAGGELSRSALLALMNGEQFDPMEATEAEVLDQFQLSEPKKAGFLEKAFNTAGAVGGIAGGIDDILASVRKPPINNSRGASIANRLATTPMPRV